MKIGILQCDHVLEKFQPEHKNYPEMFINLFSKVDPTLSFEVFDVQLGEYPTHIDHCDAYLITGSRHGVNDGHDWIDTLIDWIRVLHQQRKKLLGICFGHQAVATALGGQVIKSPKGWGIGVSKNRIDESRPWMTPEKDRLNLIVSHQDQVIKLPEGAQVLASSDFCPYYMLQIDNHILTVQGHPEFSKAYSHDLMENRREIIPLQCIMEGLASLNSEVDDIEVVTWMVNFLRHDDADVTSGH
ncbi:glutamine amidotransferase-related protein [Nitrincola alkalilacustris]|uniref:glutamine amidotransferase-related protein n=1 Tax=Nitrincola alkalilacustris TaxID=1571224 RepID=UPI00124C85FC|nr:GMP synthase [Nitrincola alkalilacustris]